MFGGCVRKKKGAVIYEDNPEVHCLSGVLGI